MTYKTKGIVLQTIKYGDTSLIATVFTELFGVQTYMLNGVRTTKKKLAKANYFQPAAILDLVVYHNNNKGIQRIKEFTWAFLYNTLLTDVVKNSIATFMVELMNKSLKQPEAHVDLFYFCYDALTQLDNANIKIAANYPLFFALHFTQFLGFKPHLNNNDFTEDYNLFFDLEEGNFVNQQPIHSNFIQGINVKITAKLLKIIQLKELENISLNQTTRRQLLQNYQDYYALHIHEFGQLKTLQVLNDIF